MAFIKEDNNLVEYRSVGLLELDLIRRARAVMGFRGKRGAETAVIDGRAMQHALRMLWRGVAPLGARLREFDVAQYAVHIADESMYWDYHDQL